MNRVPLALILVIALSLRLANALFLPLQGGDLVLSDMKGYDQAALALLEQRPLPVHTAERYLFHPLGSDTYHPPGYYYFLAGVYAVAGHRYVAVRMVQAVLDTITCLLVYLLGKEVFGEAAGLLAAALAAVYPPLIFYTGVLLTESLTAFLLTGATWMLVRSVGADWRRSQIRRLVGGMLMGLAIITRSVLLITVPLVLFWLIVIAEGWLGWSTVVRRALYMLVPIMLLIAPITIRNYQIHGKLILISTNGGVNFFLGHGGTERLKNQVRNLPETWTEDDLIGISPRTQPEEEALFYRLGWQYMRGHILPTARAVPGKLLNMYWASDYWPASRPQAQILRSVDAVFWRLALLPLSLVGLLAFRGHELRGAALLYLIIVSTVAIPLVFWAQPRFRMPVVPLFITLAAGAVGVFYQRLAQGGKASLEGTVA